MARTTKKVETADVEDRSTDGSVANTYVKDFIVPERKWVGEDWQHEANIEATRQEVINHGLRPTEHGEFLGSEEHADGVSTILHYEVGVVIATESKSEVHVIEDDDKSSGEILADKQ